MTDFEAILAQLEEHSPAVERAGASGIASFASAWDRPPAAAPTADPGHSAAAVAAAYGKLWSERRPETTIQPTPAAPAPPSREALLRELRAAEGSIDALRALRRKLAWLCHPDRRGAGTGPSGNLQNENLMAEFNARIDDAIARAGRAASPGGRTGRSAASPAFRHHRESRPSGSTDRRG